MIQGIFPDGVGLTSVSDRFFHQASGLQVLGHDAEVSCSQVIVLSVRKCTK